MWVDNGVDSMFSKTEGSRKRRGWIKWMGGLVKLQTDLRNAVAYCWIQAEMANTYPSETSLNT